MQRSIIQRTISTDGEFRPDLLTTGDMSQLDNWMNSDGMSIYIDWIPDQLNEENAMEYFSKYGNVASVRFVTKGRKTSAYVNFHSWYYDTNYCIHKDIRSIARAFPGYHSLSIYLHVDKNHKVLRKFDLKCRVNRTVRKAAKDPIQQLEEQVNELQKQILILKRGEK